ncbi:MAG: hypothetical protein WC755_08930 [Candidatus Woesearchaeota archaeon]|jgi:hypothetical protein
MTLENEKINKSIDIIMKEKGYFWCDICKIWQKDINHFDNTHYTACYISNLILK